MSRWKNFVVKGIVYVGRLFQKKGKPDRFLIVSTTGLGDTLWGTPAIRALREAYPQAYIGCLTSSLGAEVLKNNPHLNELFVFHNFLSLIKLYWQLRKKKIETALFFHTSQRAVLPLCAAVGMTRRIGTLGLQKGLDDLLTQSLAWKSGHEIERRLEMVRAVGGGQLSCEPVVKLHGCEKSMILEPLERSGAARPGRTDGGLPRRAGEEARSQEVPKGPFFAPKSFATGSYEMDFFIREGDRAEAAKLVTERLTIGLHPGAKDRFKQWPAEHFVKVGQRLKKELGCEIIVTGSFSEKKLVESICLQIEGAKPIIQPLSVMAAVLERLSFFITNDTGPLHLALAMKTPTLALFTPTDSNICGPYHNSSAVVIQAKPTCFPCLKKKCRDPFCLRQIGPEMVISIALEKVKV